MPRSSATRNTTLSTPSCTSVSPSSRASSTGPMSDTVTRTGMPGPPSMSHWRTGQPAGAQPGAPSAAARAASLPLASSAAWAMPVTSPFTSAMNTGTPAWENPSAITLSVTVLPVPDAPAMSPWRLAWSSRRRQATSRGEPAASTAWAIRMVPSSSMGDPFAREGPAPS